MINKNEQVELQRRQRQKTVPLDEPKAMAHQIARRCGNPLKNRGGWLCRCPVSSHGKGRGDKNPSLSFSEENGKTLFHCFAGCTFEDILKALKDNGLLSESFSNSSYVPHKSQQHHVFSDDYKKDQDKNTKAMSLWNNSRSAEDTLVSTYLHSRGLTLTPPNTLKFHPCLKYWDTTGKDTPCLRGTYPAMLALIQDWQGKHSAILRTYLKPDGSGKADIRSDKGESLSSKKMLGSVQGGAVWFKGESLECIAVGEGIESCLSYLQCHPLLTVCAALSTSNLQNILLPPPDVTREVIILMDHDEAGKKAANKLTKRLIQEGRKVFPVMPFGEGQDMNDLLIHGWLSKGESA